MRMEAGSRLRDIIDAGTVTVTYFDDAGEGHGYSVYALPRPVVSWNRRMIARLRMRPAPWKSAEDLAGCPQLWTPLIAARLSRDRARLSGLSRALRR